MIFHTVNSKLEKTSYNIEIKNIDMAPEHWGSEKEIYNFLDEVETLTYDKDNFDKKIVLHAIKLLNNNIRIKAVKFYRVQEENKLILLATTFVGKLNDVAAFGRTMTLTMKKAPFVFEIVEVLLDRLEKLDEKEQVVPANWVLDEKLTNRLEKLKAYSF